MRLPLFPLHTVLCPGIALPLHIFEERYRELVRHCLETSSPFGVVLIRDGHELGQGSIAFSAVGTTAEIRRAGRYPDGRYDLLVVGTGRFAVEEVTVGEQPYIVAEATLLDDEVADTDEARHLANLATRRFVTYLELLQPRDGESTEELDISVEVETVDADAIVEEAEDDPASIGEVEIEQGDETVRRRVLIPDDPTTLSYLLAGIIQIELPRRQALLECETTDERLRGLLELIDRETFLLRRRLRAFVPTPTTLGKRGS
ncbi:MAG: LON peptidase substrate-binding domain-containing protein [Chloroflexota bacterium]